MLNSGIDTHASNAITDEELRELANKLSEYMKGREPEDLRRIRLQNGIYSERLSTGYFMIRIRLPAGRITPEQLEAVADIAETFRLKTIHFTTRQDIQLHWAKTENVVDILKEMRKAGLTSREACYNSVRNVVCSHLAGICVKEPFDISPYARALSDFFLRNPLNQNLPRKFKINLACCPDHWSGVSIADIGIVAALNSVGGMNSMGFRIFVGGGLGSKPYVAEPLEEFTPIDRLLSTCAAIIKVFDRKGDRVHMYRNRLRYLLRDLGFAEFRRLVFEERSTLKGFSFSIDGNTGSFAVGDELKPKQGQDYERWFSGNVVTQKQRNFYMVYVLGNAGDFAPQQLRILSTITARFSKENVGILTPNQTLALRFVSGSDVAPLFDQLHESHLDKGGACTVTAAVGCTGTTSCNLALTNSRMLTRELQKRLFEERFDMNRKLRNVTIKVSGCPNSCGQHPIASIGLVGCAVKLREGWVPSYAMLVGGSGDEKTEFGTPLLRVPARLVPDAVVALLNIYVGESGTEESFNNWISRLRKKDMEGFESLRLRLDEFVNQRFGTMPVQLDWDSLIRYRPVTAKGECAP